MVAMAEPTTESNEVYRILEGLVDTEYLAKLFARSEQTIMLWRQHDGLPYVRIPGSGRDTIRYDKAEVLEWARKKGKRVHLPEPSS